MQNISLPPQINNLPTHSTAPAITGVAPSTDQPPATFNHVLEHELSDRTDQTDMNQTFLTTNEQQIPIAAEIPAHPPIPVTTVMIGQTLTPGTVTSSATESILPATVSSGMLQLDLKKPGQLSVLSADNKIQPSSQMLLAKQSISSIAPDQTTPAPTQVNKQIKNNFSANYTGQQYFLPANSAATSQFLPLSEVSGSQVLPVIEDTTFLQMSDAIRTIESGQVSTQTPAQILSATQPAMQSIPDISLDTQFGQPKWSDDFAQKIVWLTNQQHQVAEIRLNPAHLGPIEIVLSISNDQGTQAQATAHFVASHHAVRDAIEAALPKLRELLSENGIALGHTSVNSDSPQQQNDSRRQRYTTSGYSDYHNIGSINQSPTNTIITSRHLGIINTFA